MMLGFAICTSLCLMLFSDRLVVFVGLMICFMILVMFNASAKIQDDTEIQKYAYGYIVYRRLYAFWSRIPTVVTAEHRYIATLQNINPRKGVYKEYFKDAVVLSDSTSESTALVDEKPEIYTTAISGIDNNLDKM